MCILKTETYISAGIQHDYSECHFPYVFHKVGMMENPGTSSRLVSVYQPKPAALSPLASKALKRGKNRSITWLVRPPALHLLSTHLPGLGLIPLRFSL